MSERAPSTERPTDGVSAPAAAAIDQRLVVLLDLARGLGAVGGTIVAVLVIVLQAAGQYWALGTQVSDLKQDVATKMDAFAKSQGDRLDAISDRLVAVEQRIAVDRAIRDAEERQRQRERDRADQP